MRQISLLGWCIGLLLPFVGHASVLAVIPSSGYAIKDPAVQHLLYGTLAGESAVVTLSVSESRTLSMRLFTLPHQPSTAQGSIVLVNVSRGDVQGILESGSTPWEEWHDWWTGSTLRAGPVLTLTIPAGEYRLVVNNPDNTGPFGLWIDGTRELTLQSLFRAYQALPPLASQIFGLTPWGMMTMTLAWAFTSVLLVVGAGLTWILTRTINWKSGVLRDTRQRIGLGMVMLLLGLTVLVMHISGLLPMMMLASGMLLGAGIVLLGKRF